MKQQTSVVERWAAIGGNLGPRIQTFIPHLAGVLAVIAIISYGMGVIAVNSRLHSLHVTPRDVGVNLYDYLFLTGAFFAYVLSALITGTFLRIILRRLRRWLAITIGICTTALFGALIAYSTRSSWDTAIAWSALAILAWIGAGLRIVALQIGISVSIIAITLVYLVNIFPLEGDLAGEVISQRFPMSLVIQSRLVRVAVSKNPELPGRCLYLMGRADGAYVLTTGGRTDPDAHVETYLEPIDATNLRVGCL
jgi:hypothetical protein